MAAMNETGNYKNMTSTGAITTFGGSLIGYHVNSTTSGTIVFRDGGSSGTVMNGTSTPAAGFNRFPATYGNGGLHVTIGGTLDVTFFFIPGGQA